MKKMFVMVGVIAGLSIVSVRADDSTREKRSAQVNLRVGSVGVCAYPRKVAGFQKGYSKYETSYSYSGCATIESYEAEVTGSFWNKKETKIEGTSTYSYKERTLTNDFSSPEFLDGDFSTDIQNNLNVSTACSNSRKQQIDLKNAQASSANLCNQ